MPSPLREVYELGRLPAPSYLREHFHYNPDTGVLCRTAGGRGAGSGRKITGRRVHFDYGAYAVTRFIYALRTGHWPAPEEYICFVDGNPRNLKWDNLILTNRATQVCYPGVNKYAKPKKRHPQHTPQQIHSR